MSGDDTSSILSEAGEVERMAQAAYNRLWGLFRGIERALDAAERAAIDAGSDQHWALVHDFESAHRNIVLARFDLESALHRIDCAVEALERAKYG